MSQNEYSSMSQNEYSSMSQNEYLFFIYSCKKNLQKAKFLYDLLLDKIHNCKVYIIYGNNNTNGNLITKNFTIHEDKYLILDCGDNYENLTVKTFSMLNVVLNNFSNIKGVFKCDDDIIPNIKRINNLISMIKTNENIQYLGKSTFNKKIYQKIHYGKCSSDKYNIPQKIFVCKNYAAGPLYYLSINAIKSLINFTNAEYCIYEDITVGYNLMLLKIPLYNYNTYYDELNNLNKGCLQNYLNYKKLYVLLHGGLGNQLFQVSTGYSLAKDNNMIPILVYHDSFSYYTHNKSIKEFLDNIFSNFNSLCINSIQNNEHIKMYKEDNKLSACYEHNKNIITDTDSNYFIHALFPLQFNCLRWDF
jgi:hypothetical protein